MTSSTLRLDARDRQREQRDQWVRAGGRPPFGGEYGGGAGDAQTYDRYIRGRVAYYFIRKRPFSSSTNLLTYSALSSALTYSARVSYPPRLLTYTQGRVSRKRVITGSRDEVAVWFSRTLSRT